MTEQEIELCKSIGREMLKAKNCLRNEDFIFNEEQWAKYYKVIEYAEQLASMNGGELVRLLGLEGQERIDEINRLNDLKQGIGREEKWELGVIGIRFKGEITFGDGSAPMEAFKNAIDLCDGFDIFGTGLDDGSFEITFYVNNLNIPKKKFKR